MIYDGNIQRIDIHFTISRLVLSYFLQAKKGYVLGRSTPHLYIKGQGLVNRFKSSSDKLRWWSKEQEIQELHGQILKETYISGTILKGTVNELPLEFYEPMISTNSRNRISKDLTARETDIIDY